MRLAELARQTGMLLVVSPPPGRGEVARLFVSNTMSDLIANAGADTLIVTSLNNSQLARVAELMDVPGICLAGTEPPGDELVEWAKASGTAILQAGVAPEAARGLLAAALEKAAAR